MKIRSDHTPAVVDSRWSTWTILGITTLQCPWSWDMSYSRECKESFGIVLNGVSFVEILQERKTKSDKCLT